VNPSLRKGPDGFGVSFAFGFEDAGGEGVGGVGWFDVDDALQDDWAVVEFVVGEVDRASGDLGSVRQHRFMHMMAVHPLATKGGEQGRVDVNDSMMIVGWYLKKL